MPRFVLGMTAKSRSLVTAFLGMTLDKLGEMLRAKLEGGQREAGYENDGKKDSQVNAAAPQRQPVVVGAGMLDANDKQEDQQRKPGEIVLDDAIESETAEHAKGDLAAPGPEEGMDDMPTVQLADRKEIQGGDEHSRPSGKSQGVEQDVDILSHAPMRQPAQALEQERLAQSDYFAPDSALGNHLGKQDPYISERNRQNESGQRAGSRDVEQRTAVRNARRHANDGAERPKQGDGKGNEVRQTNGNAVSLGGEVMAEFVREQNGKQSGGEVSSADENRAEDRQAEQ